MKAFASSRYFSVIVPLYNKATYIEQTLQSVLHQDDASFEIVVVDDGSTDDGPHRVSAMRDPRIRLIRQTNAGVSAARNRGAAEAHGEWLAFLDGDDLWKPGMLAGMERLRARYPDCGFLAAGYETLRPDGSRIATLAEPHAPRGGNWLFTDYFGRAARQHIVWTGATVVHRDLLAKAGGFPVGISHGEDRDTWARVAFLSPLAYCNEVLAVYRNDVPGQAFRQLVKSRLVVFDTLIRATRGRMLADEQRLGVARYVAAKLPTSFRDARVDASTAWNSFMLVVDARAAFSAWSRAKLALQLLALFPLHAAHRAVQFLSTALRK